MIGPFDPVNGDGEDTSSVGTDNTADEIMLRAELAISRLRLSTFTTTPSADGGKRSAEPAGPRSRSGAGAGLSVRRRRSRPEPASALGSAAPSPGDDDIIGVAQKKKCAPLLLARRQISQRLDEQAPGSAVAEALLRREMVALELVIAAGSSTSSRGADDDDRHSGGDDDDDVKKEAKNLSERQRADAFQMTCSAPSLFRPRCCSDDDRENVDNRPPSQRNNDRTGSGTREGHQKRRICWIDHRNESTDCTASLSTLASQHAENDSESNGSPVLPPTISAAEHLAPAAGGTADVAPSATAGGDVTNPSSVEHCSAVSSSSSSSSSGTETRSEEPHASVESAPQRQDVHHSSTPRRREYWKRHSSRSQPQLQRPEKTRQPPARPRNVHELFDWSNDSSNRSLTTSCQHSSSSERSDLSGVPAAHHTSATCSFSSRDASCDDTHEFRSQPRQHHDEGARYEVNQGSHRSLDSGSVKEEDEERRAQREATDRELASVFAW